MASVRSKVLIVDDDPSHLEIYGLLMEQAGLQAVAAQVRFLGVDLPENEPIELVLLDYKLHSIKTSADLAQEIRRTFPGTPIILLSDLWSVPSDIEPYVTEFVRKGEPVKLIAAVRRLISCPEKPGDPSGPGAD